jgi:hypothetical protein
MLSRSAALFLVSISAASLVTVGASCNGDTVVRQDAAVSPATTKPSSSGGSGGLSSSSKSSGGGTTGSTSSSASSLGGSGGQSSGGQSKAGASGGNSASSSSAKSGGRGPDSTSTATSSSGRPVDAAAFDAPAGHEAGPPACNDITSNNRLAVYYYTGSQAQTQDLAIHMALINYTALTARLSQVKVRYWFTDEGAGTPNLLQMYYTPESLAKITTRFVPANPPRIGADTVLEFTFSAKPDAGVSFVEITDFNLAFHKDGYAGTFDQANDYSYDGKLTKALGPNPKITAYIGDELAWGCEPPIAPPDAGSSGD